MPNARLNRLAPVPAPKLKLAVALALGLGLAGCGGMPENTTLYSVKQPVVERTNMVLDVNTNASGLPLSEQQRLNGWFETMDLRYGDRIAIEVHNTGNGVMRTRSNDGTETGLGLSNTAARLALQFAAGAVLVLLGLRLVAGKRGFAWLDGSLHGDVAVRRGLQTLLNDADKPGERQTEAWLAAWVR
jgi:pilus assembly protein CpaD